MPFTSQRVELADSESVRQRQPAARNQEQAQRIQNNSLCACMLLLLLLHMLFVLLVACLLVVTHQRQHLALGTSTSMQMQPMQVVTTTQKLNAFMHELLYEFFDCCEVGSNSRFLCIVAYMRTHAWERVFFLEINYFISWMHISFLYLSSFNKNLMKCISSF